LVVDLFEFMLKFLEIALNEFTFIGGWINI